MSGPHVRLQEACEALGYDFRRITRNADPESYEPEPPPTWASATSPARSSRPQKTYLVDAQANGAEILAGARATRVLVEDGRAAGVEARWVEPGAAEGNGSAARLEVRAPVVVVAAGAIESPALLLRSRIGGAAVGDNLRLHPTVAVTAYYDEPQNWMWGPPQAALSHEFADLGEGYGFLIESAQATTGLFGGAVPWRSGADHKRRMREWAHASPLIALVRERGHGRVEIDGAGNAVVHYPIDDELDRAHLKQGVEELVRIHEAAGAREIVGSGMRARRLVARRRPRGVHRRAQRAGDRPARVRHLLRPPDGNAAGWDATQPPRSRTPGASCTTHPAYGSATPRRSPAPRAPTRWPRSWPWLAAPRTRSPQAEGHEHAQRQPQERIAKVGEIELAYEELGDP